MDIENIVMLPPVISPNMDVTEGFKKIFSSDEAKVHRGIVYFYLSETPIPRIRRESRILYIGKTTQSLRQRWLTYASNLGSGGNGEFYRHVLDTYGSISIGYVLALEPKVTEAEYFERYRIAHLEFPPKSKIG